MKFDNEKPITEMIKEEEENEAEDALVAIMKNSTEEKKKSEMQDDDDGFNILAQSLSSPMQKGRTLSVVQGRMSIINDQVTQDDMHEGYLEK